MLFFRNEIGSTTAGIAEGRTWAVLCSRENRRACLDIFLRLLFAAITLSHALGAVAQGPEAKPLSSTSPTDTDWTYYCDPSHKVEPTDRLNCVGGNTDSKRQISISGEVRMRGEYFDHIRLGESSPSSGYLLQRSTFALRFRRRLGCRQLST